MKTLRFVAAVGVGAALVCSYIAVSFRGVSAPVVDIDRYSRPDPIFPIEDLEGLGSWSARRRAAALGNVVKHFSPAETDAALDRIAESMKDDSTYLDGRGETVSESAMRIIAGHRGSRAIHVLVDYTSNSVPVARWNAWRGLILVGERALKLRRIYSNPELGGPVRSASDESEWAAKTIEMLRDQSVLDKLRAAYNEESTEAIREVGDQFFELVGTHWVNTEGITDLQEGHLSRAK
jgi:hypothetical protein